jgi:hypothetical protein
MSDKQGTVTLPDERWEEALGWHARLEEANEAEMPDTIHAWEHWVAADENRLLFDQVLRLFEDGARTRRRVAPISDDSDPDESPVQLAAWRPPWRRPGAVQRAAAHKIRLAPRVAKVTAVAAAIVGVLLWIRVPPSVWRAEGSSA